MILTEDFGSGDYRINAYEPGIITINKKEYTHSLIISAHQLLNDWRPQNLAELNAEDLQPLVDLAPTVILLGTGKRFILPDNKIFASLAEKGIGIEYMDTGAACRTFMALMSEGRNVVAALLID
jgi:uncharacterized protein